MRSRERRILLVVCLAALSLATTSQALTFTDIVPGISGGAGIAADPLGNVYYTESATGMVKRVHVTPACDAVPALCMPDLVAAGMTRAQDVALDLAHNVAYVTTNEGPERDDGSLWRINLSSGIPVKVATRLGQPGQIALDLDANVAYVAGHSANALWKIDLGTGTAIKLAFVVAPTGLVINRQGTRAYTAEMWTGGWRFMEIDLTNGNGLRTVATSIEKPSHLAWSDAAEGAFYVTNALDEGELLRVDIATFKAVRILRALPSMPAGVAVVGNGAVVVVATDSRLLRQSLVPTSTDPTFIGVGLIPALMIGPDGYANTPSEYVFPVTHSPFGGSLDIFGNLSNFQRLGATHYRVYMSRNGEPAVAMKEHWTMAHVNAATGEEEMVSINPDQYGRYEIPKDYPDHPERWSSPNLMMRWPSDKYANGTYTFKVEIIRLLPLPPGIDFGGGLMPIFAPWLYGDMPGKLTLKVDNTPATVKLTGMYQAGSTTDLKACDIVNSGPSGYQLEFTASDVPDGHLNAYGITATWGNGATGAVVKTETYAPPNIDEFLRFFGVTDKRSDVWTPQCNCAHMITVWATKRTINGYRRLGQLDRSTSRLLTINNVTSCP